MIRTFASALALVVLAMPAPAFASSEYARLRPLDPALKRLAERGATRSPTLRRLIDRLERTDVAVFLDYDPWLPKELGGGLRFVTKAGPLRLLRISLSRTLSETQCLQMIAHELQHALEIAGAPDVRDQASLSAFYRTISSEETARERFDTAAAQRVEADVRDELRLARGEGLYARAVGPATDPGWMRERGDQRTRR